MTNRTSNLNSLPGRFDANVDDDARVLQSIEKRMRETQWQLDDLKIRWERRVEKLEKRGGFKISLTYDVSDVLA